MTFSFPPGTKDRVVDIDLVLEKVCEFVRLRKYVVGLRAAGSLSGQYLKILPEIMTCKGMKLLAPFEASGWLEGGILQLAPLRGFEAAGQFK